MPKLDKLLQTHPSCDVKLLKKYQALYEGGPCFKKHIDCFLTRNGALESSAQYKRRVDEANYVSYVSSIINTYAAHLFSAPYTIRSTKNQETIDLDPYYTEFKEDVDLSGTDLTTFFKNQFTEALIKKNSYWLIEFPDDGEPLPDNLLDFEARGLNRAYLRPIPTENLINFECDSLGCFEWAIVYEQSFRQPTPFSEQLCVQTFKVYEKDKLSIYEIVYEKNKRPKNDVDVPLVAQYPNRSGQVPILGLSLPDGLWLLNQTAEAQIEHFRLDAALGWALRQGAYATLILNLDSPESLPIPTPNGVAMGKEEKAGYIDYPTDCLKFIQDQIGKKREEIYRVSSQMALSVDNSAAALGRSGDSKQADQVATEICLRGYASLVKEAIENTFEFISNARGETDLKFSIEGMNKFSLVDTTTLVTNASTVKAFGIPSETFEKELYKHVAQSLLPIDTKQEIKDQINKEIDDADLEALKEEAKEEKLQQMLGSETESSDKEESSDGQKIPPSAPQEKATKFSKSTKK